MRPLDSSDVFIREYIKNCPRFVVCFEFETAEGETYTICQDQDGEEWIEES